MAIERKNRIEIRNDQGRGYDIDVDLEAGTIQIRQPPSLSFSPPKVNLAELSAAVAAAAAESFIKYGPGLDREALEAACTGSRTESGIQHDGDTCPVHEAPG